MLRAMMFENQVFFDGAKDENSAKKARQEFLEAFFPQAEDWKRKAIADGDQAFAGILKMENYIPWIKTGSLSWTGSQFFSLI